MMSVQVFVRKISATAFDLTLVMPLHSQATPDHNESSDEQNGERRKFEYWGHVINICPIGRKFNKDHAPC